MAVGTRADVVLNTPAVHNRLVREIPTMVADFYASTVGMVVVNDNRYGGEFVDHVSWENFSGYATRRNSAAAATTAAAADINKPSEVNERAVKLDHKNIIHYREDQLRSSAAQYGSVEEAHAQFAAEMTAAIIEKQVFDALSGLVAAISGAGSLTHDAGAALTRNDLNVALGAYRKRRDIVGWVMSPDSETALMTDAIGAEIEAVGGVAAREGTPQTLGLPYVVVDAPALGGDQIGSAGPGANKFVLGLTAGAAMVSNAAEYMYTTTPITVGDNASLENRTYEGRVEGATALMVKGYGWDQAQGSNPTGAALGTSGNWLAAGDPRNSAGVVITHT